MMDAHLSLSEALKGGRLSEFIDKAEAEGVGPVAEADFNGTLVSIVAKAPQPVDRTSRSPAPDLSPGK
jgi:hypothetical protein